MSVPPNPLALSASSLGTGDEIAFYITVPSTNSLALKKFPGSMPVKDVISKLSSLLSERDARSQSRYHLYSNGLRFMDEERSLSTYTTLNVCPLHAHPNNTRK
jgi:hypothetical protein